MRDYQYIREIVRELEDLDLDPEYISEFISILASEDVESPPESESKYDCPD